MAKKTAKNESPATAAAAAFTASAERHSEKLNMLLTVDVSAFGEDELKDHKNSCLAARNRAERAKAFAALLQNEKFAAAWVDFALEVSAVERLQIYAQDKLIATLQAIAADCALSNVRAGNHSNMMTQRLVAALQADGSLTLANAPRRMHDLFPDKSMGTYSAQASSSRQVLETLGMVAYDALTKAFSLNERGNAYLHVIAK